MKLAADSLTYLTSNIINSTIPFILLPILTRVLSPAEYGQLAMFQVLVSGLSAFVGINSIGAANRKFFDKDISKDEIKVYNANCINILFFSIIIVAVFFLIFSEKLSSILIIPEMWIYYSLIYTSAMFLVNLRLGQWQVRGKSISYGKLQISNCLVNMIFSLTFVLILHNGAEGRVDAQLWSALIMAGIAFYFLLKDGLVKIGAFNRNAIHDILRFGVPLIPHIFCLFILSAMDRFFINKFLGIDQAGIYMVAVQISLVLSVIFDALNKAYIPWLFKILEENEQLEKIKVVKLTYAYFLLLVFFSVIPFFLGPWIISVLAGGDYSINSSVVGYLCLGQIFGGMYLAVTNYIFFARKTEKLAYVTLASGGINIVLMLWLIPSLGLLGCAIAFSFSKFIQFLFTWLLAANVIDMPWNIFRC